METIALETLKYPVGRYKKPETYNSAEVKKQIKILAELPEKLRNEVAGLSPNEFLYIHRPEGWTIRQLTHHIADSHMNALIRIKLSLTEDNPTIKPYTEKEWAKLPDTTDAPVEWSLQILEGVHNRMVKLLEGISEADMQRTYLHPEYKITFTIYQVIAMYAWHCDHHLAHIKQAKKHKNSF